MHDVACPKCGEKTNLEDTENGTIYPFEIKQDFKCGVCGTVFEVTFTAIAQRTVEIGHDDEPDPEEA